jgi:hypothetical protein
MAKKDQNPYITTIWGIGGVIGVLLIAVLASQVGGATLRGASPSLSSFAITVPEPLVRGVQVAVRWDAQSTASEQQVFAAVRSSGTETEGEAVALNTGQATIHIPCTGAATVTVLVRDVSTYQILSSRSIDLLPAGRDCLN